MSERDKVPAEDIAAFLDGRLSADDRTRVAGQLADNADARRELVDAARIVASMPRTRLHIVRYASMAAIAAAAVFAVVVLQPGKSNRTSIIQPAERRAVGEQARAIELVTPLEGKQLLANDSFSWRAVEGASYRIVIVDAAGKTVFQENTSDTVHSIPAALSKNGAGRYYWSVDALLPDGSSATSEERDFLINTR